LAQSKTIVNIIKRKIRIKKVQPQLIKSNNSRFIPSYGIVGIGVKPSYRGQGLGTLLIKEFETIAKNEDAKKIGLSVAEDNLAAIKTYTKNGFSIVKMEIKKERIREFAMEKLL
jgi:ribosomal protein S18 acetylase RimI-like enzyme